MDLMTKVWVDTSLMEQAALKAGAAQTEIGSLWSRLGSKLSDSKGMGGNPGIDKSAAAFVPVYDRAAAAAWQGFGALHRAVGDMAKGLTQTANNHLAADHHSTLGNGFSLAPSSPALGLLVGPKVAGPLNVAPAPSAGDSNKKPAKSPLESITGIDLLGGGENIPTADEVGLLKVASDWNAAHNYLVGTRGDLHVTVVQVTRHSDAPDVDAFGYYWKKVYQDGHPETVMEGLPQLCLALSRACEQYAVGVRDAKMKINDATANPIALIAEAAAVRAMLAQIAGQLLKTVSGITAGVLADHIINSVTVGAANVPDVRILQAELDDSVLREWKDYSSSPPDPRRLTKDENDLAEKLHRTRKEIEDAIHKVKDGPPKWRGLGKNRNPDMYVDPVTGEVYPEMPNGKPAEDSIGNIIEKLPAKDPAPEPEPEGESE
ncbi:hypothetical protein [Actinomadura gamaensis]|uniref:Outer membrane channel protein CpnT-like N-terminal domain-containing protein n=1 Tax=Actinomadura gamaensis TaxID=1763541 RepID=A0ABV9U6M2_9ACTN